MEKKPLAFVIMPFDSEFAEVHKDFLLPTLEEAGFEVRRADDLFDQRNILQDIVESISGSDLIVADLTGLNPNVFYELGIAHATRRPVILLTQAVEELPFDLRSYRVIEYSTHFAKIGNASSPWQKCVSQSIATDQVLAERGRRVGCAAGRGRRSKAQRRPRKASRAVQACIRSS